MIFITAYADPSTETRTLAAGAFGLTKPVVEELPLSCIHSALGLTQPTN
jgi:CheY-like chemotaxis protein